VCVVAGFIGNQGQWESCVEEWQQVLNRRKRKALHMTDLRWNQRTKDFLDEIGPIPHRHGLTRIMGAVNNEDCKDLIEGRIRDRQAVPYLLSMQACVAHVLQHLPEDEKVAFVFECHSVYRQSAQTCYHAVLELNKGNTCLHSLTHIQKDQSIALQPADYLAYELAHYFEDKDSQKSQWGLSILGNGDIIGARLERGHIRNIVDICIEKGLLQPVTI